MSLADKLLDNIIAILGFGFLGLSVVMVVLAYMNVQQVTSQANPNEAKVSLSRYFMTVAIISMIASAPLHWVTILIEAYVKSDKVNILVTMDHSGWTDNIGDVILVKRGEKWSLVNNPYRGTVGNDDEIRIDADKVLSKFRDIRAQLATATNVGVQLESETGSPAPASISVTRNVLEGG